MGFLPQSKSTRSASNAFDSPVFRPAFAQRAFTPAANAAVSATSLKVVPSLRSDGEWELLESAGGVDSMQRPRIIISEEIACPVEEDLKACIQAATGPIVSEEIACPVEEDPKACVQAAASPVISEEIACPVEEELQACIKAFADQAAAGSIALNARASAPKKKDQASIMAWHASRPQSAPKKKVIVYDAEMFARSQRAAALNSPTSEPKPAVKQEAPAAKDVAVAPDDTAAPARSYKAAMAANPPRPGSRASMAASAKKPSHAFDDAFDAIAADHINKLDKA
jgi:hypothetical protein